MTPPPSRPAPVFDVSGGPPTDAAIAAMARLLLAVVDEEEDDGDGDEVDEHRRLVGSAWEVTHG